MMTTTFESIVSDEAKKLCYEYSENPGKLKEIFEDKKFDLQIRFEVIHFFFPEDKEKRQILTFIIFTKNGTHTHRFGMSINDTKKLKNIFNEVFTFSQGGIIRKIKSHLLYDILCALNFSVSEEVDDFANEFGYNLNKNYRLIKKIHKDCLDQYKNCVRLFGEDFTDYFPR